MEYSTETINTLREIRKLLSILNQYGDCIVPTGVPATERLRTITGNLVDNGYTLDDIEMGINHLPSLGY